MSEAWLKKMKQTICPLLYNMVFVSGPKYRCPICGYYGHFKNKVLNRNPRRVRIDSKCLRCGASERHRMMYLVIENLAETLDFKNQTVLHIAPEACLKTQLTGLFKRVDTADLFMKTVDFKEDLQKMTFPDNSYDWVVVSRVLSVPPDLNACLDELRRVVRPGGGVVVAETYTCDKTLEYEEMVDFRSRIIGLTLLDKLKARFQTVEKHLSNRYAEEYQLINQIVESGDPKDDYPELVRCPDVGFSELVVVCYADQNRING